MKNLEIGLYFYMSHDLDIPDQYDLMKDAVSYAEKAGFSFVWVVDGYFQNLMGLQLNPAVIHSALSVTTSAIQLRGECMITPIRDVLREAEEWSVIDNLSDGRVGLAVYSSYENEKSLESTTSYVRELKDLWAGKSVPRKNGVGEDIEIKIFPRPIQEESPVWIPAANDEINFETVGKSGANLLTFYSDDNMVDLKRKISLYREATLSSGFNQGKVSIITDAFSENNLDKPIQTYFKRSMNLIFENLEDHNKSDQSESRSNKTVIAENEYSNLLSCISDSGADELACLIDLTQGSDKVFEKLKILKEKLLETAFHLSN